MSHPTGYLSTHYLFGNRLSNFNLCNTTTPSYSLTSMTTVPWRVFHGTLIHAPELGQLAILEQTVIVVNDNGRIVTLHADIPRDAVPEVLRDIMSYLGGGDPEIRYLRRTEFLIPGFVDTHNHAPQYDQAS